MLLLLGAILVGLLLYTSILAFALPEHSRSRLSEMLRNGHRDAWLKWIDQHELSLRAAFAFVRLAAVAGLTGVGAVLFHTAAPNQPAWVVNTSAAMATLALVAVFGVGLPLAIATHLSEPILARSLRLLAVVRVLMLPIIFVLTAFEVLVRRLMGKPQTAHEASERAEQEILDAVSEGEAHGAVDEDQKEMIESIIHLHETPVSAIMTPRTDIDAVPVDCSFDDVRDVVLTRGHSRVPVFDGTIDHIVGVVYAKDLLRLTPGETFDARKIMRSVPYVPETKNLDDLLEEFRTTKVQIAIVLDEYGGTAGLATIEDILEELVGEIDDEYDQLPAPMMNRVDEDTLDVDARVHVSEINAELDIHLPEEDNYETLGGFVFATLGKIPAPGESFEHENVRFEIVSAEPRKINRLRLHVQRQEQSA